MFWTEWGNLDLAESQGESGQEHHTVTLRPVGLHDWQFLYDLLAERPKDSNISHKIMPSIAEHVGFLRSNPYQAWYIIELDDHKPAGAIYLTHQDEIGIHIAKPYQRLGIATKAILELMRQHLRPSYLANIAPLNNTSQKLFMGLGFELIQQTYELRNG